MSATYSSKIFVTSFLVSMAAFVPAPVAAQQMTTTIMADGLENPWAFAFLPDDAVLVTERPGRMRIVKNGVIGTPLDGLPDIEENGQGGLLDVVLADDFATSGTIFFSYAKPVGNRTTTAVSRATLMREGDTNGRLTNVQEIFAMSPASNGGRHFGSRIVTMPDGTLFITTGDRGDAPRAQNMQDHAGAVIRINPDGSIPSDNPYADGREAMPEIWSKGHRNPQGAARDPITGAYYTVAHGARGGDEINRPEKGKNYGWPIITYGRDYSGLSIGEGTAKAGLEQPLFYWDPSIAPSGMAIYDGPMFPEWQGDFFVGALRGQALVRIDRAVDGTLSQGETLFQEEFGRIRDVRVHPDGAIWIATDEAPGQIIRIAR